MVNTLDTEKGALLSAVEKYAINVRKVFDCGSRDALDGIELGRIFSADVVEFFECNPDSVKICEENIRNHASASFSMHLHPIALGDSVGTVKFFPIDVEKTVTPHAGGNVGASSLFLASEKYKNEIYAQNEIEVPITTLETHLGTASAPNLLWMDLQGAELMALMGMGSRLAEVDVIHIEVGFRAVYKGQPLFSDIDRFLSKYFFLEHIHMGRWPRWVKLYGLLGYGPWISNAIYVNRRYGK